MTPQTVRLEEGMVVGQPPCEERDEQHLVNDDHHTRNLWAVRRARKREQSLAYTCLTGMKLGDELSAESLANSGFVQEISVATNLALQPRR